MNTRLRVHLYSILWNEAAMLGFFFRHYDPWVSRYVFFDDGSTDGTLEILARHPRAEVRRFERRVAGSFVESSRLLHDTMWKESRGQADWVVITAVDEHLHHREDLVGYLEACHEAGVTLVPALGYDMVAAGFPPAETELCRGLTRGAPSKPMSKLSLFRPDALRETRFHPGRHKAAPTGEVVFPERDELLLLHYKHLGRDYTAGRQALLATGLGEMDRAKGWGNQYLRGEAGVAARMRRLEADAVDVAAADHLPWRDHGQPRWWRGEAG